MRLGKLSNEQLEALVLSKFKKTRPESLGAPQIGEDCAALDFQGDLIELSTDPITSARINTIGALTVHVSCNDAAAAGADPVALMVTLLAPPSATEAEIGRIADDLAAAAKNAGVDIVGGHTEVTDAVTRYVTNTTVIARIARDRILPGPSAGDEIVMTKWAGLEGSAIIASDYPELAYCHGLGVVLDHTKVPVKPETTEICNLLSLDVHRLISSGSMLLACPDGKAMCAALAQAGIPAAVIGQLVDSGMHLADGREISPPEADELYRLFQG